MDHMDNGARHKGGRIKRAAAYTAGAAAAVIALAVLAFLLPPVRGLVLSKAIEAAGDRLPGSLTAREHDWRLPLTLELGGVLWIRQAPPGGQAASNEGGSARGVAPGAEVPRAAPEPSTEAGVPDSTAEVPGNETRAPAAAPAAAETLLVARSLEVSIDPLALFRRDLNVKRLVVHGLSADLPAIRAWFPAKAAEATSTRKEAAGGPAFPRAGSVRGLPSAAAAEVRVDGRSIVISEGAVLDTLGLSGSFDFRQGERPRVKLDALTLRATAGGGAETPTIERADLSIDVAEGRLNGMAAGALSPEVPLYLNITSERRDSFLMTLGASEGDRPFEQAGLEMAGTLIRSDGPVSGLAFDAKLLTPGIRGLSRIPALAERLQGYPDLEGIPAELHGLVTFEPSLAVRCSARIGSNDWLERGAARVAYGEDVLSVDPLSLDMRDLTLGARGRLTPDSLLASARVEATGARWLKALAPSVRPPDSLALNLTADVAGPRAAPTVKASLDAAARVGSFTLDRLIATAETPSAGAGAKRKPLRATLYARALGAAVATTADISPPEETSKPIVAELTPLLVRDYEEPSSIDPARMLELSRGAARSLGRCDLEITPQNRRVAVDNLRLTGGLGELQADGDLGAKGAGSFEINWTWPSPPSMMIKRAGLAADLADSLRARWPAQEPPELALRGRLDRTGAQVAVAASGRFSLPGPAALSPLLPAGARVDDLGSLKGDLRLAAQLAAGHNAGRGAGPATGRDDESAPIPGGPGAAGGRELSFEARLDLGRTAWIDTAIVSLRGAGRDVTIDSARVAFEGLSFDLAGTINEGYLDLRSDLDLSDARVARRLHPALPADLKAKLGARAALTGRRASPRIEASFAAAVSAPEYALPRVEGTASWNESGLNAEIDAPNGLVVGPLQLDSLTAAYAVSDTSGALTPGRFEFSAAGERLEISHKAVLRRLRPAEGKPGSGAEGPEGPEGAAAGERQGPAPAGKGGPEGASGWLVETESFAVSLEGSDLRSTRPFDVSLLPSGDGVSIEGLSLAGTLGSLTADGYASREGSNLSLNADLALPKEPPFIEVSEGLWPLGLEISLTATEDNGLRAAIAASGLALGDRRDLVAKLSATGAQAAAEGMDVEMIVSTGKDTLFEAVGRVPLRISMYSPSASFGDGPVSITATARALPIPMSAGEGTVIAPSDRTAALDCGLELTGTSKEPQARGSGTMTFPGWPKLSRYQVNFAARMSSTGGGSGAGQSGGRRGAEPGPGANRPDYAAVPELEGSGLAAAFDLEREGKAPASGTLLLPLIWSLHPATLKIDDSRDMDLAVRASDVGLSDFDNFLPPRYGLKGKASFNVAATGPAGNPNLSGRLSASEAGVVLEDGTRVIASAAIDVAGTRLSPTLDGKIEIHNGVIVLPESSKKLLPAQGQAALWVLEPVRSGETIDFDSAVGASGPAKARGELHTVPEPPKTRLQLDVSVEIPGGLWLRGRGLDVGLAGNLRLVQKGALPAVTGELEAVQGRFVFLGQVFTVERGKAVFYGGDEINPSLEILLTTTVGETEIRITLGGSVNDPKLELSSVPELPEGDIMSLLIFGRTMDQLDNDQLALLGSRAADIATAFGTAQLEAALARQLGVDVLRIKKENEQAGGRSVVIGKYISTRVLLKYEQALGDRAMFFVNLEYLLTKHFRLETLIGHESQSAVELNWTKEH